MAYLLPSGNTVVKVPTANGSSVQYELSDSAPAKKTNHSQEYLDTLEVVPDSESSVYAQAENACVYGQGIASHDECLLLYAYIQSRVQQGQ